MIFSMIILIFSNSMIFPRMELFLVIFQVFHDFQSLWEPCMQTFLRIYLKDISIKDTIITCKDTKVLIILQILIILEKHVYSNANTEDNLQSSNITGSFLASPGGSARCSPVSGSYPTLSAVLLANRNIAPP